MSDRQRTTNLLGAGTYAQGLIPKLIADSVRLGGDASILTAGRVEMNRLTAHKRMSFAQSGIIDVSPDPHTIRNAVGYKGDVELALVNQDVWEPIVHEFVERVVRQHAANQLIDGQTIWPQGMATGHSELAAVALDELKIRLPRQSIIAMSVLPDDHTKRLKVGHGYALFVDLWNKSQIETTFLADNLSPFARRYTLDTQDAFQARAVASLIAGQSGFVRNVGISEAAHELGRYSPWVGMAFASRSITIEREPTGWSALRALAPRLPERGVADVSAVVLQAKEATKAAVTQPDARAIDEPVDLDKPFFLLYTVPLPAQAALWRDFASEIRRWLGQTYPTATPFFAIGPGMPDPRYHSSYWVQVSAFYPLPVMPAPLRAIQALPDRTLSRGSVAAAVGRGSSLSPGTQLNGHRSDRLDSSRVVATGKASE